MNTAGKMLGRGFLFLALAAISASALLFALFMQYVRDLEPCDLCIVQRWPYIAAIAVGIAGTVVMRRGKLTAGLVMAATLTMIFTAEVIFAAYHIGVEQHWWKSVLEGCTISFDSSKDLLAQIQARSAARCDEVSWSLFGLSMAAWNGVLAFLLSVASGCLVAMISRLRNRTHAMTGRQP